MSDADALIEEAAGWLADLIGEPGSRDGEPPTREEVEAWAASWLVEADAYLTGDAR